MNKINRYIEVLFEDVPNTRKAIELKEELSANLNERYEDYLAQGKSETQSYGEAIANMGDIDDLLVELKPTKAGNGEVNRFRKKRALLTAIAVMIYILAAALLIILDSVVENESIGVVVLLILVAIATGIIIYANMSIPKEISEIEECEEDMKEKKLYETRGGRIVKEVSSVVWSLVTVIYFAVSFTTQAWHLTWLIWVIGSGIERMIHIIFELREADE